MEHPDPHPLDLDDAPFREARLQLFVIHVPGDRLHRGQRAQLSEHVLGNDVAGVQDEIGLREEPKAFRREPAGATRQVRVCDDRDGGQRDFLRFGFALRAGAVFTGAVIRNGLLAKTFVRAGFISAWRRVAST
jgi:hypothetical protein